MLVHVFEKLMAVDAHEVFLRFLEKASGWDGCEVWRQGREFVVQKPLEEDEDPKRVQWSSAKLYQKLEEVHSKISFPVLWKLCRYYDTDEESSEIVRTYLHERGVSTERVPFFLVPGKGHLKAQCTHSGKAPKIHPKKAQIAVDKSDLTVILLPHRGVVRALLRRLEEVAL